MFKYNILRVEETGGVVWDDRGGFLYAMLFLTFEWLDVVCSGCRVLLCREELGLWSSDCWRIFVGESWESDGLMERILLSVSFILK